MTHAVDRVRGRHINAVNAGDVEGALGVFAPEAAFLPPGQSLEEPAAIPGWFTYFFANFRVAGFDIQPDGLAQNGDLTLEHGRWVATRPRR